MTKDLLVLADEYAAATATFARALALKDSADSMSPIAREAGDKRAALSEALDAVDSAHKQAEFIKTQLLAALLDMNAKYGATQLSIFVVEALTAAKQAQPEPFTPDWSQDSAAAESIREHQAICNLLLKEMRYIAGISTGQVKRVAEQALEAVKQAHPERAPLICTWTQEDDFDMPGVYHTSCGEMWSFTEGGIKENNTKFCPHCGGGIKQGCQHD